MIKPSDILHYLLEALAMCVAVYLITKRELNMTELGMFLLTIAATFLVLDQFSPTIGASARQGSGFGIGFPLVGGGCGGASTCSASQPPALEEGMDDPMAIKYYQNYNPPYEQQFMPPAYLENPHDPHAEAPPVLPLSAEPALSPAGAENFENVEHFENMGSSGQVAVASEIARRMRANPFQTTIRSVSEIDGSAQDSYPVYIKAPDHPNITAPGNPLLYDPLTPPYGYRYQFPQGWDQLEQPGLPKALSEFENHPSHSPVPQNTKPKSMVKLS